MPFLLTILALCNVLIGALDWYTTTTFLRERTAVEANPLSARLIARFGVTGGLAIDFALTLLIVGLMVLVGLSNPVARLFAIAALVGMAVYRGRIVAKNFTFLKK